MRIETLIKFFALLVAVFLSFEFWLWAFRLAHLILAVFGGRDAENLEGD